MTTLRRPLTIAVAAVLAAAVTAVAVSVLTRDADGPPAARAARLVPASALAYVHLSTDRERDSVRQAAELVARFPALRGARDSLTARLTAIGPGLSYARDVRPWLGRESALALLDTPTETAVPVAVLEVADRARADAFLDRSSTPPQIGGHRGVRIARYGQLATAFLGDHLVVGPEEGLRAAIDVWTGTAAPLATSRAFRRATGGLPSGRVLDAYLSGEGVRRLLVAQTGPLAAVGDLLAQPGLEAVALSLSPSREGLRLRARKLAVAQPSAPPQPAFRPRLVRSVPADALSYLGFAGLDRRGAAILGGLAGDAAPLMSAVLARVRSQAQRAGVDLERELLPLLRGEVAVWLRSARGAPALTLIAAAPDEAAARRALERLRGPVERALTPPGDPRGGTRFEQVDVAGVRAQRLRLGPGVEVATAVFDGKLVASTSLEAIRAVRSPSGSLADSPGFEATLGRHPPRVTSLVFLDFGHLLRLGQGSGGSASPAYRALGADLRKLRAVGAATTAQPSGSTTDITVQIPEL